MPFGREGLQDGIGLALSGGGFRAALFHLGALRRLVELGVLTKLDRISSVSGGSIVTGRLAEVWEELTADPTVANYERLVGDPIRSFCERSIDIPAILKAGANPFSSAGLMLEKAYAEQLITKSLDALPDHPVFIFNATNMQTGRNFRFSKRYMGDWRIGLLPDPLLPVARAVAASSAFPPYFSPITLKDPGPFEAVEGADLNNNPAYTRQIRLADGGVYDNLGLETVWKRCRTVLVSDAGAHFQPDPKPGRDWLAQAMRSYDIVTDQSRGLRKRWLIEQFIAGAAEDGTARTGTYWGLSTDIANYGLGNTLPCKPEVTAELAKLRTRLNHFTDREQRMLINFGYALTDAAVRRHTPEIVEGQMPAIWPYPAYALG
ncbi:NTE family protein [Rhodobacter aestuarii]|uniref:NTE family protein n=1 Tax=Rhodobacter aestuarii TaxID=453582 RepID=A0A1N7MTD6_9RHOB|nr:patatin-like phospholipase family protein [Rhodobacter aestuarii]PTV96562.1 NTE family protein [Rhodobacter aestuarii]SIS89109.1 NTE family protein [Rhodobacter aestuarii]